MNGKKKGQAVSVSLDKSQFEALSESIQNLVKVLAAAQIKRDGDTGKNARFLKVFGLTESEIADLLGVTQPAVNQALSKSRGKRKSKKDSKGSNDAVTKT